MNTSSEPVQALQAIQYTLEPQNHSEIQKLILQTAAELRRLKGVGKGRAQIMAEDYVAEHHIAGGVSGPQLASWLGSQHNGFRKPRKGKAEPVTFKVADPQPEAALQVATPLQDSDTFAVKTAGKQRIVDPVLAQLIEKCRPIKPQQVWSFPVKNQEEAQALAAFLPQVSAALGWRNGRKSRTYIYQIFPDRLKIKRMI